MKKAALTICSVSNLPQARVFAESLRKHHPEYRIFLGLLDRLELFDLDPEVLADFTVIELGQINFPGFENPVLEYDMEQLKSAVKPFMLHFILKTFTELKSLVYFDSDVQIFSSLKKVEEAINKHSLVVCPQALEPYSDGIDFRPNERDLYRGGIFSSGFLGVRNGDRAKEILVEWGERILDLLSIGFKAGRKVEPIWLNLLPIYYGDEVGIIRERGLNVSYWNLHERVLFEGASGWELVGGGPLISYHFTGFDWEEPWQIAERQNRYELTDRHDLAAMVDTWVSLLRGKEVERFQNYPCYYLGRRKQVRIIRFYKLRRFLMRPLKFLIRKLEGAED